MCKGTVNMEDVYLINVNHLSFEQVSKLANPQWIRNHGGIPVDKCIGKEMEHLINQGVITVGCCCGHGETKPTALVMLDSRDILNELGYKLIEYTPLHTSQHIFEIELGGFY